MSKNIFISTAKLILITMMLAEAPD